LPQVVCDGVGRTLIAFGRPGFLSRHALKSETQLASDSGSVPANATIVVPVWLWRVRKQCVSAIGNTVFASRISTPPSTSVKPRSVRIFAILFGSSVS